MSTSSISRLRLESLDARIVPSATVVDLTGAGSSEMTPSGAIVQQGAPSGVSGQCSSEGDVTYDPFLRLNGRRFEQGYNSDRRWGQFNEQCGTRSLTLGEVPVVTVDGVAYREFVLSINQNRWSPRLSLDELRIYTGDSRFPWGYNGRTNQLGGRDAVFDLDAGGDISVLLKDRVGHRGPDMVLLIPDAAFNGAATETFVTLYSRFGGLRCAGAGGGAEVWSVRNLPPPAEPTGASISGFVQLYSSNDEYGEYLRGIEGAVVHLEGTNDLGEWVSLEVVTDANGAFTFTNLRAGTYTLWEEQPLMPGGQEFYGDGFDMLGTIEGTEDPALWGVYDPSNEIDMFMDIQIGMDQMGVNYTFTEILV